MKERYAATLKCNIDKIYISYFFFTFHNEYFRFAKANAKRVALKTPKLYDSTAISKPTTVESLETTDKEILTAAPTQTVVSSVGDTTMPHLETTSEGIKHLT